jgi:nicotinamide-nucleotide adenylyltransferase
MQVVKDILKENAKITIVIGGPARPDARNPFSFTERERMIRLSLHSEGISKADYRIFKISDVNDDAAWNAKIKRLGKFDVAYSRNLWVIRCLKKIGVTTRKHKFYERYKNCGREIRKRIIAEKTWQHLLPAKVFEYMRKINGEERIRKGMRQRPVNY